jgi:hypothetical protein
MDEPIVLSKKTFSRLQKEGVRSPATATVVFQA